MELIWEYLEKSLNNKEIDEKEFRQIEKDLNEFSSYVVSNNIDYISVDENIIDNYSEFLEKKYKYLTAYRKVSAIGYFYQYLLKKNKIDKNPIDISVRLNEKKKVVYINKEDYEKLINNFDKNNREERRDRIIIRLLYETNLKLTEILNLKKIDFLKYDYRAILIINKGNMVPKSIPQDLGDEIKDYSKDSSNSELFLDVKSTWFKEKLVYYGLRSGLDHILTPMILRNAKSVNEELELKKNEVNYLKKIKEVYMSIGIGDD